MRVCIFESFKFSHLYGYFGSIHVLLSTSKTNKAWKAWPVNFPPNWHFIKQNFSKQNTNKLGSFQSQRLLNNQFVRDNLVILFFACNAMRGSLAACVNIFCWSRCNRYFIWTLFHLAGARYYLPPPPCFSDRPLKHSKWWFLGTTIASTRIVGDELESPVWLKVRNVAERPSSSILYNKMKRNGTKV